MSATLVQLIDGRFVESDADEWAAETLARYVMNKPTLEERRAWLADYERRNGKAETDRLRDKMLELHATRLQPEAQRGGN